MVLTKVFLTTESETFPFSLQNSSAELAQTDIEPSIQEELKEGRMFGPFLTEELSGKFRFWRSSPMGMGF
jgi:hypothetical protein